MPIVAAAASSGDLCDAGSVAHGSVAHGSVAHGSVARGSVARNHFPIATSVSVKNSCTILSATGRCQMQL